MKVKTKAAFVRTFPWTLDWKWYGATALAKRGSVVAKLELEKEIGFTVQIMSTTSGRVDAHTLWFADFIRQEDCTDYRNDGRGAPDYPMPETSVVTSYTGRTYDWYLLKPRDTTPYVAAVESYVKTFFSTKTKKGD